uniref:uncharacterized protein PF11_0207-like n=1 Tax=Styela clava TaxID=7725 RepID=UPI00193AD3B9|nr:uncharacterized protein PF11_0207-like [Styela clava]
MDLENTVCDVLKWHATTEALQKERNSLVSNNKTLKAEIAEILSTEKTAKSEIATLRQSSKTLQESLLRMFDYKTECEKLKGEMKVLQKTKTVEMKRYQEKIEEMKEEIENLGRKQAKEVKELRGNKQAAIINLELRLNEENMKWQNKLDEETRLKEKVCREKDEEIVKQKMEFDNRIKRLQEQNLKIQNRASSSATGNNVFRKKLQHEKETSAKRIAELEAEVNELNNKLNDKKDDSFISGYSRHIASSVKPFKKRKTK